MGFEVDSWPVRTQAMGDVDELKSKLKQLKKLKEFKVKFDTYQNL